MKATNKIKVSKDKISKAPVAHAVGRRKKSIARVFLRHGSGQLKVNDLNYTEYFDTEVSRMSASMPFVVCDEAKSYDVVVNVVGGGKCAQADAVKLGFARALVEHNQELKPVLRQNGLLTVDSRVKERKKYGQRGARRKFQFVKR
jgi:small subunit ribosomal protein S9